MPLSWRDALRLGFLGYLFNFISPGAVGGDLFKVVFLARERQGRRTEVAMSVLVDRLMGLYGVFVVGTVAILLTDMWRSHSAERAVGLPNHVLVHRRQHGGIGDGLAARLQRRPHCRAGWNACRGWATTSNASIAPIECITAIPWALPCGDGVERVLAIAVSDRHLADGPRVVQPRADAGRAFCDRADGHGHRRAFRLAPNGMGTFELLVNYLYQHMPSGPPSDPSAGLVVALCYRVVTVLIALVGVGIYLASRREMTEVLHEAEEEVKHPHEEPPPSAPASHQPATT